MLVVIFKVQNTSIHILIQKLDAFTRKYYHNEFYRGSIIFLLCAILYVLTISFVEHVSFLSIAVRSVLFYGSITLFLAAFVFLVLLPLLKMWRIGKTLNYKQASKIIERHFPEIKDTIINALELSADENYADNQLAIAAIEQKIQAIQWIPFTAAVDFKKLLSFGKYAGALAAVVVVVVLLFPGSISQGATRIMRHSQFFEKPAPFQFVLDEKSLVVVKGQDCTVSVEIQGSYVPNSVEILMGGTAFLMQKKSKTEFEYTFKACNNNIPFQFRADEYVSKQYAVQVNPLPEILQFTVQVQVPSYTGLDNFEIQNTGDISFPAGSKLTWKISSNEVQNLALQFVSNSLNDQGATVAEQSRSHNVEDTTKLEFAQAKENSYSLTHNVLKSTAYRIMGSNDFFTNREIIAYSFTAIPDMNPQIEVEEKRDSTNFYISYFKGLIQDDYGFSDVNFVYYDTQNPAKKTTLPIQYNANVHKQDFYFMFDFSQLAQGSQLAYYFEVWDNDAVFGKKSVRSAEFNFTVPTDGDIEKLQQELSANAEKSATQSMNLTNELLKDISALQRKMLQENMSDWERAQVMQELQNKQEQIKQQLQELAQTVQQKSELSKQLTEQEELMLEKQRQIQELFENLMDDELKKMFEDFNKLMNEFKKDEFMKQAQDMKFSYEDLQKQLDKDLQLLKRFDVEQQVRSTYQKMNDLAQEQEQLSEDLKNSKNNAETLEKQQELERQLQDIKNEYNDALEKNQDLQQSFDLPDFKQEFQEISQEMQQSKSEQQQGAQSKSSKSMKKAQEKTQDLAQKMQQKLDEQLMEQTAEDIDNLRLIVHNLLNFSFKQEELIKATGSLAYYSDPKYADVAQQQTLLRENFNVLRDSLFALSQRQPQISAPINKELANIQRKQSLIIAALENARKSTAQVEQRYVMTAVNDLLLMLGEALNSMQQQLMQQQQQCSGGSCNKPGNKPGKGNKPSMQQMQSMQQGLKQQMQQMLNQMKNGGMQQGSPQMQQKLSEILQQQQMAQQMMQQLMQNGNLSPEGVQQLKEIQKMMEQSERDIINQSITQTSLKRQENILTRMLESEKSLHEREFDQKRESNEAKDIYGTAKNAFGEKNRETVNYNTDLQQSQLQLRTYYRKIFNEYLLNVE